MGMDLEYIFDGTFEGFLCCIYASYVRREVPMHIYVEEGLPLLGETATWITTNWQQAQSVYVSLSKKIGIEAQDIVKEVFLTHQPNKEMLLFRYIRLGYQVGRAVISAEDWEEAVREGRLSERERQQAELVFTVLEAAGNYKAEVKNIEGKLHFRSYTDVMISCITPRNRVLPSLAKFFEKRFSDVNFLLYDKTHKMAAVHREEGTMVTLLKSVKLPVLYDEENVYENLWKSWYDHLHIELPENPRYALNEMRTRLWCEVTGE
ncbi:MAG: DUF4130 domain-containing protein [Clostridiales bacterium]|nr:DUF4130 domain-containing protein [Clostridiales bacterium]